MPDSETWWARQHSADIQESSRALLTACEKVIFMIITESFVWINFPKTASTFVRECLRELYTVPWWNFAKKKRFKNRWIREIHVPNISSENPLKKGKPTPHGLVSQIPSEYKNLQIVSALRMPLGWRLSLYRYGHWKKQEALTVPISDIIAVYPNFPDLTFDEFNSYLEFKQTKRERRRNVKIGNKTIKIGIQSAAMIKFFSDSSEKNYDNLQFETCAELLDLFAKIRFFDADSINIDLHSFLLEIKFCKKDIDFILHKNKVNTSNSLTENIATIHSEKIKNEEWLVYKILKTRSKNSKRCDTPLKNR